MLHDTDFKKTVIAYLLGASLKTNFLWEVTGYVKAGSY
jgi:hypothetical protein